MFSESGHFRRHTSTICDIERFLSMCLTFTLRSDFVNISMNLPMSVWLIWKYIFVLPVRELLKHVFVRIFLGIESNDRINILMLSKPDLLFKYKYLYIFLCARLNPYLVMRSLKEWYITLWCDSRSILKSPHSNCEDFWDYIFYLVFLKKYQFSARVRYTVIINILSIIFTAVT